MAANSGTTPGNIQGPIKPELSCGECGSYSKLNKKAAKPKYERDHIPSKACLFAAAIQRYDPNIFTKAELSCVENKLEARGITVAIPRSCHREFSPTCGSRNTKAQIDKDASSPESLAAARDRDLAAMPAHLDPECAAAYEQAAKQIKEHDNEGMIEQATNECTGG